MRSRKPFIIFCKDSSRHRSHAGSRGWTRMGTHRGSADWVCVSTALCSHESGQPLRYWHQDAPVPDSPEAPDPPNKPRHRQNRRSDEADPVTQDADLLRSHLHARSARCHMRSVTASRQHSDWPHTSPGQVRSRLANTWFGR